MSIKCWTTALIWPDTLYFNPMFKWEKMGLMFQPSQVDSHPWISEFTQAPSVVLMPDVVRVYFATRPPPDANGNYTSLSAYVDFNRKNLFEVVDVCEAPLLPLGDIGSFDEFGVYFTSVVVREGAGDIIAYYVGYTRCSSVPFTINIGAAVSADGGRTFSRMGRGPLLPCTLDEPFFLTVPRVRRFGDMWYMFYSAGKRWVEEERRPEPVYHIRMATSKDGVNWQKANRDLIECRIGDNECQACPDVFWLDGKFHMFFCYRSHVGYHGKSGGYRLGYASSTDLMNWERNDSKAGITVSDAGWDSEMISFPHVFELDGDFYMLYLGNEMGKHGFGIAKLAHYVQ